MRRCKSARVYIICVANVSRHSEEQYAIPKDHTVAAAHNTGLYLWNTSGTCTDRIHRYCGVTPDHCLVKNGCQNGCSDVAPTQSEPPLASISSEPVLSPVGGGSGGPTTTDGTCGATNQNTVCGDWPNGNCCSVYGFW